MTTGRERVSYGRVYGRRYTLPVFTSIFRGLTQNLVNYFLYQLPKRIYFPNIMKIYAQLLAKSRSQTNKTTDSSSLVISYCGSNYKPYSWNRMSVLSSCIGWKGDAMAAYGLVNSVRDGKTLMMSSPLFGQLTLFVKQRSDCIYTAAARAIETYSVCI